MAKTLRQAVLVAAIVLTACADDRNEDTFADIAFTHARAWTLDETRPWADTVLVRGDTIVYVGDASGAANLVGEGTQVLDLDGKLLLPGFIDTHMHLFTGGSFATALSLDTFGTVEEWVLEIEKYARANPDLPVVFGYGFLATTFGPEGPKREMIDAVVADRPVLIRDEGFHAAWANTAALDILNITQDTPDPVPGFSYYRRDADGNATGYLLEDTARAAMDALDVITTDAIIDGTALVIDIMNSYGVTSAFDAGAYIDEGDIRTVLASLERSGDLTIRLAGSSRARLAEEAPTAVAKAVAWRDALHGKLFHYNTLKISDDGTVEGRTAAMFEDYQGEPGNSGETVFSEAQMTDMVTAAAGRDLDVHVHALGERAVHESLNAIEAAREAHPDSETRYTLCHIQVIADQDVPRFAELDVIAQSTPLWASYDVYGKQFVNDDQFRRYWRFGELEETGARLTFGSDFPSSGAGTLGLSPLVQIEIGRTRQYLGDRDAPVQPLESNRLSVESLVRGFTIDAAYQLHREDETGSIEVGKKADLVVLDRDIFTIDPYTIHDSSVVMTMLDGKVVYEAWTESAE